jgi:hypothetical protein
MNFLKNSFFALRIWYWNTPLALLKSSLCSVRRERDYFLYAFLVRFLNISSSSVHHGAREREMRLLTLFFASIYAGNYYRCEGLGVAIDFVHCQNLLEGVVNCKLFW